MSGSGQKHIQLNSTGGIGTLTLTFTNTATVQTYTLPVDGTNTQVLQTNGAGVLSWVANGAPGSAVLTNSTTFSFQWTVSTGGTFSQTGSNQVKLALYSDGTHSYVEFMIYNATVAPGPNIVKSTTLLGTTFTQISSSSLIPATYRPFQNVFISFALLSNSTTNAAGSSSANVIPGSILIDTSGNVTLYFYNGTTFSQTSPSVANNNFIGIWQGTSCTGSWIVS